MTKKKTQPRPTVGQQAAEALQYQPDQISVMKQQQAMQQEYMKHLLETIDAGYNTYKKSFFVEVITKNEKLLPNVFRNYFCHRLTCPTPNYDQSVYRFDADKNEVQYIWTVPSRDASHHLKDNAHLVVHEERELLSFVLKFADGTLYNLCKKYNNEMPDSPILAQEIHGY